VTKTQRLHLACETGNLPEATRCLTATLFSQPANINAPSSAGDSPLHIALAKGHHDLVRFLLSKGANPNIPAHDGNTPLHIAATHGYHDIVELLISRGAAVEQHDSHGVTPLGTILDVGVLHKPRDSALSVLLAAKDMIILLISKGANVNTTATDGRTPLHWAASKGDKELIEWLVSKGAEIDRPTKNGICPLGSALTGLGTPDTRDIIVLLISKGANVNATDDDGYTALHWAARRGDVQLATLLISRNIDINRKSVGHLVDKNDYNPDGYDSQTVTHWKEREGSGHTALYLALTWRCEEMAGWLVSNGADVNVLDSDGRTLLVEAVVNRRDDRVPFLLSHGANANIPDSTGATPLHHLCSDIPYRHDRTEALILAGADVNVADRNGNTPLFGVWNGECARLLIQKGADVLHQNNVGETALSIAAAGGRRDVIDVLVDNGVDINANERVMMCPADADRDVIVHGTPLYFAALGGNGESVTHLIARGAKVTADELAKLAKIEARFKDREERGTLNLYERNKIAKFRLAIGVLAGSPTALRRG
jgi:ankyrin repeat protein